MYRKLQNEELNRLNTEEFKPIKFRLSSFWTTSAVKIM